MLYGFISFYWYTCPHICVIIIKGLWYHDSVVYMCILGISPGPFFFFFGDIYGLLYFVLSPSALLSHYEQFRIDSNGLKNESLDINPLFEFPPDAIMSNLRGNFSMNLVKMAKKAAPIQT